MLHSHAYTAQAPRALAPTFPHTLVPAWLQVLVLVSPYSWLPAWTAREKWLGGFKDQARLLPCAACCQLAACAATLGWGCVLDW